MRSRLCRNSRPEACFGQFALHHALPAPDQAQNGLQPRPTSANWQICPGWPATPALFFTQVRAEQRPRRSARGEQDEADRHGERHARDGRHGGLPALLPAVGRRHVERAARQGAAGVAAPDVYRRTLYPSYSRTLSRYTVIKVQSSIVRYYDEFNMRIDVYLKDVSSEWTAETADASQ